MSLLSFAHEHLARLRAIHKHGKMGKRSIATYFLSTKCTFLTSLNGWISTLFVIVYCDTFCMILPRVSQSFTRTQAFLIKDSLLGSKRTRTEHSKIEIKKKERETLESFWGESAPPNEPVSYFNNLSSAWVVNQVTEIYHTTELILMWYFDLIDWFKQISISLWSQKELSTQGSLDFSGKKISLKEALYFRYPFFHSSWMHWNVSRKKQTG